jgi:ribosomal protein L33
MMASEKPHRIIVRCSRAKFDPHPRVRLLHDMTNDNYIIETHRRQTGRLYVRKFGSRDQAEKFFRNLTTGERL